MTRTREYLLYNAVLSWLSNYGQMKDAKGLTLQYRQLKKELQFEYEDTLNEQPKNNTMQKRGRPAKRQRTQKTSSSKVSKEKS